MKRSSTYIYRKRIRKDQQKLYEKLTSITHDGKTDYSFQKLTPINFINRLVSLAKSDVDYTSDKVLKDEKIGYVYHPLERHLIMHIRDRINTCDSYCTGSEDDEFDSLNKDRAIVKKAELSLSKESSYSRCSKCSFYLPDEEDGGSGAYEDEEMLFNWSCLYCGVQGDGAIKDEVSGTYKFEILCRACGNDLEELPMYLSETFGVQFRVCLDCSKTLNIKREESSESTSEENYEDYDNDDDSDYKDEGDGDDDDD